MMTTKQLSEAGVTRIVMPSEKAALPQHCPHCGSEDEILHKCDSCGHEWYETASPIVVSGVQQTKLLFLLEHGAEVEGVTLHIKDKRGRCALDRFGRVDWEPNDKAECQHDEHDHGVCLDCGADLTDKLAGQAEAANDAREGR